MSQTKATVIDCGDALGIADVGDLYATLLTMLAEGKIVDLDVSAIERIDAASMQMLYAFYQEMAARGHQMQWDKASSVFRQSAALLGLAQPMNIEAK